MKTRHLVDRAPALSWGPDSCEDEVLALLAEMSRKAPAHREDGREAAFRAEQNALVVKNAEAY